MRGLRGAAWIGAMTWFAHGKQNGNRACGVCPDVVAAGSWRTRVINKDARARCRCGHLHPGDPAVDHAAIVGFTHLLAGFDNPTLVRLVGALLDQPYTSRQATYDLRRLKRKGLIVRLPGHPAPTRPTGQTRCRPVHQNLRTGLGPGPRRS